MRDSALHKMASELAGTAWSQHLLPSRRHHQSISSSSSSSSSLSSRTTTDRAIACHPLRHHTKLSMMRSLEMPDRRRRRYQPLTRAVSAGLDAFFGDEDEDEFITHLQDLTMRLRRHQRESESDPNNHPDTSSPAFPSSSAEPLWPSIRAEDPTAWPDTDEVVAANLELRANRVDLPVSIRMIKKKKKKRREEGFKDAGETACCSVKRAFSSMVFIIRELQSYTLQMRQALFVENLQGILSRVHGEMHASFVWLFQHIFSCTPTLMLSLMLLLANFTVYSMGHHAAAMAAAAHPQSVISGMVEETHQVFDTWSVKAPSPGVGRTASVGGGGGGGKARPVAGATGDGRSRYHSHDSAIPTTRPETTSTEGGADMVTEEEEEEDATAWNRFVEESWRMQAAERGEALMDPETLQRFVSPVTAEMQADDQSGYLQTELTYRYALSEDPDNTLLLANFAQFLFLVLHDHDRAEHYYKRAAGVEPADAESLSRYASFLWVVRKDLEAAEEAFLEAIAADPGNTFHAANYAHFLWNTGGTDTCYPLD